MIETSRLLIRPLTYEQLVKYLQNDNSLEAELNLTPSLRSISPELKEALEQTQIAEQKTKEALEQKLIAERQTNEANRQKGIAEEKTKEAIRQENLANESTKKAEVFPRNESNEL